MQYDTGVDFLKEGIAHYLKNMTEKTKEEVKLLSRSLKL
jgi:hypothetical protein